MFNLTIVLVLVKVAMSQSNRADERVRTWGI